jgi:hypothetical protein
MSTDVHKLEKESLKVIERAFAQVPESLQYIKKRSLANLYKYLTFKALEGNPVRKTAVKATYFILNFIKNDPSMLQKKISAKALLKSIALTLLSHNQFQKLLKYKNLFDITSLLMHTQLDP